ncbi:hypothetical protein [Subtercola vilae]|uniref:Uncharacterized protein n=1 Tax=Subtercola vilae TaxID=2056433 RepID=A0A4T2BPT1_9MICO|nr:hypothetical protein [Subtercola vilae]TIH33693.1 hypothetical protein D4765_14520 [Subtercola vilae]
MKWYPLDSIRYGHRDKLAEGGLVAYDFKAWRVIEIRPMDDESRISVRLRPVADDWTALGRNDIHLSAGKYHQFDRLPEHYSVCVKCGDIQPCREVTAERDAAEAMERAERYDVFLRCPACLETVTPRQKQISFQENVVAILGPMVTFHLRSKCQGWAVDYEKKWAKVTGGKITLSCEGHQIGHHDGTRTCLNIECPSPSEATHGRYSACWVMNAACNRPECMAVIDEYLTKREAKHA